MSKNNVVFLDRKINSQNKTAHLNQNVIYQLNFENFLEIENFLQQLTNPDENPKLTCVWIKVSLY